MTPWHWRSSLFVLVLLSSAILSLWSYAEEFPKVCDPEDPEKCSQALQSGSQAPFSGQLLTPKLAIDLGQKAAYCDDRLKLELRHQKSLLSIELELEKKLRMNDQKYFQKEINLLTKRLAEAHSRPWYEHPAFVATVTAVAMALIFYGSTEALKAMK